MDSTTLVLGATGTVGGAVARALAERGVRVRGATRNPAAAPRGAVAEWVALDLERPETFGAALSGVERVFLLARPGDDEPERLAAPLVEAMGRAGVRRVVNLSAMGVERMSGVGLRVVEELLEATSLEWTHLRPNFFMQVFSTDPLRAGICARSELRLPTGDARLSFIDVRDIAEVAAIALTEPDHAGAAYTLTGGEALDHHAVARVLSEATGREIRYTAIGEEEARAQLGASGFPEAWVERLIGFYRLVRAGACEPVSGAVETVLGRPPIPFERFAREHAGMWGGGAAPGG